MNLKVKTLVLLAAGINCDKETELAFELAGSVAEGVHINDLIANPKLLKDYQILAIPGGFSFGDDISSGQVLAQQIKCRLTEAVENFIADGKLVLGICNGFQVLVKLGLLPGTEASIRRQEVALTFNTSVKFEDRWVYLQPAPNCRAIFLKDLKGPIYLPVRHGEGRFVADAKLLDDIKAAGQIGLRYVDKRGDFGDYPVNPNGSLDEIAGISDPTGRIFGMMPHPEVFIRPTQHPRWTRDEARVPAGLEIFKNAVKYFKKS